MIVSGSAVHVKGLGSALCSRTKRLMAAWRSTIEWKTPRLSLRFESLAKKPSTALSQEQEVEHRAAPQFLLQHDGAIRVNAVKLKDGLGQIDPECCNLHVDGSFPLLVFDSTSLAHRDAVGVEPSTPSEEPIAAVLSLPLCFERALKIYPVKQ
jgi:hypothetical protein